MSADRRAIFFDIDRTIWDRQNRIPDSTREAMRRLREAGHLIFISSGRCRGYIRSADLLSLNFHGIISGCGTMTEYEGKVLSCYEIPREQGIWTVDIVRGYGMKPILEGKKHLYLSPTEFAGDLYGEKLMREMEGDFRDIDEYYGSWEFSKLSVDMKNADIEPCFKELSPYYDFLVHSHNVAEIVPKGFDKANCIGWAEEYLGIPVQNTVAFGDGVNDMGMIKAAGLGVAMGNGTEALKEAADYVAPALDEDGIFRACETLGLI